MRSVIAAAFALWAGAASWPATFAAQEPAGRVASFRGASSELVVLPVVVQDKQGRFVPDLEARRFAVYDNGRPQPVSLFTNRDAPVTVGLVIDTSGSMGPKLPYVRAATVAFARSSNPDDEIFVIAFNDDVKELLPGKPVLAANKIELEATVQRLVAEGRTALYDALMAALDRLDAGTHSRKVLVLISDGGDNVSRATLEQVLARSRQSNAAIYAIGLFDNVDPDQNPGVLKALAKASGGEPFLPTSAGSMMQACDRIAREIRNEYTLAYIPPERDGTFHTVRIQIEPPDHRRLTVRTRPGYFASGASDQ